MKPVFYMGDVMDKQFEEWLKEAYDLELKDIEEDYDSYFLEFIDLIESRY